MSTENRVFSRLFKGKTKLSKKVALGQVDDLMALYDQNYILEGQMLEQRNKVNDLALAVKDLINDVFFAFEDGSEIAENLRQNNEKMSQILADIDLRVGELGIDSSDVVPDYNKIVDFIGNTEETNFYEYIGFEAKDLLEDY
tara:strand:- start:17123 stop:17548 length:426 start_codon:yes stop_codon:yes gene_type:complete